MLPEIDRLWIYSDPVATEQKFRDVLRDSDGEADEAYKAELLTQIARTLGLQQKFDEADAALDEADALITIDMVRPRVRSMLERGRMYNSSNRQHDALPCFTAAFELALDAGLENLAVDAAHMLGIVEKGDASLRWNEEALRIAEGATDPWARSWLGSLYNNIGWTYVGLKRYEDALFMFERNEAFRTAQKNDVEVGIARWCIAKMYRFLGRVDESLQMQMELLKRPENTDNTSEGYCQEEIGECLHALGKTDEAAPYFARAWELLSADIWIKRDEQPRLDRLKQLGKVDQ